jgi:methionyl-tRNA synthetase
MYVQQSAPWALAKAGREGELDVVLAALGAALVRLALMVAPFMPGKAQELWTALGQTGEISSAGWGRALEPGIEGAVTRKPDGLFPRPAPA